jgi:hypothetical protein
MAEACPDCGFVWEAITRDDVFRRVHRGIDRVTDLLLDEGDELYERPIPERWSAVEYTAHLRDVLVMMRDRLVIGLVEDTPSFAPMYRDERVDLGLYRREQAGELAEELRRAGDMFTRLFGSIEPAALNRPVIYNYPSPTQRTLLWMGQQVVHEVEHHATDIEQNVGDR